MLAVWHAEEWLREKNLTECQGAASSSQTTAALNERASWGYQDTDNDSLSTGWGGTEREVHQKLAKSQRQDLHWNYSVCFPCGLQN